VGELEESKVDMTSKICLVTGANSGIGKATALGLAKLNPTVVVVSRDKDKGEAALLEIRTKSGNKNIDAMVADLSSQDSVRELAHDFKARYKKLHVLINNAGIFLPRRVPTAEGLESTFATNHLGHFLLTNLLLDQLRASAPSRIINLTSSAHFGTEINFEDLQGEKKYSGYHAYSQSKLANVLFTYQLAKQLEGTGVTVNCLHPGVVRTGFGKDQGGLMSIGVRVGSPFMMSPEKAARAVVYLASSPELEGVSGKFFSKGQEKKSSAQSYDPATAEKLWKVSAELTRLDDQTNRV
jgi:NAD(P)-dependent dehydrogenase (short-subunit alcohol dehydrogenase family)